MAPQLDEKSEIGSNLNHMRRSTKNSSSSISNSFIKTFKTTNDHSFRSHGPFFIILPSFESQFKILFTGVTIEEFNQNKGNSQDQDQIHSRHRNHRARRNLFINDFSSTRKF